MRFAVVGDPVEHSRSPAIQSAAFTACGIEATYEAIQVAEGRFGEIVAALRSGRLTGVNVTMPHKDAAFAGVDHPDQDAERTRSVNTVVATEEGLWGHNTDVSGVRRAMEGIDRPDAPVLVLGYGGAARAALVALAGRDLYVSGRDATRAAAVGRVAGVTAEPVVWGRGVPGAVVVNATPLGMEGERLPDGVLDEAAGLLDMVYGDGTTPAVLEARRRSLPHADGVAMLVAQAVGAFELFTGVPAPVEVMERAAHRG